jgi:hypothetical protein
MGLFVPLQEERCRVDDVMFMVVVDGFFFCWSSKLIVGDVHSRKGAGLSDF